MTPGRSASPTELLDIAIDWQMQLRAAPDSEALHRAVAAWRAIAEIVHPRLCSACTSTSFSRVNMKAGLPR